ncbi:3'5'-cyclic nucleotide phosphodiesterase family protein [Tritrichomonas foetus]|uniref:3'5'-cyclic nucleotide phosphodiesterase family protein n=1 Tax=Tritrichomonas foetus TaxID=1144522 RepID=A0A1J4L3K8_9EUKA|nr:3'5'-cyclic nucleotide phosphodiesterase family protein [Tritrichomonas foetus]|eukprot:OHT16501.1 3'5'-cyclic nucleotide phosphodiesterase family protein [Tritrichomonas foetus]
MKHYGIDPRKLEVGYSSIRAGGIPNKASSQLKGHIGLSHEKHRSNSSLNVQKSRISPFAEPQTAKERVNRLFDAFIKAIQTEPLYSSLEKVSREIFMVNMANVWFFVKDIENYTSQSGTLFSQSLSKAVPVDNCLLSKCIYRENVSAGQSAVTFPNLGSNNKNSNNKEKNPYENVVIIEKPTTEASFNRDVDYQQPTMLIPVYDSDNNPFMVIQLGASNKNFGKEDENLGIYFTRKLSYYSHFFAQPSRLKLNKIGDTHLLFTEICHKLSKLFNCRAVEFWGTDVFNTCIMKYNENAGKFVPVGKKCGVVKELFKTNIPMINITDVTTFASYDQEMDGKNSESALLHLMIVNSHNYAIVLRGKSSGFFNVVDERILAYIVPLTIRLMTYVNGKDSGNFKEIAENGNGKNNNTSGNSNNNNRAHAEFMKAEVNVDFAERLKALLEVAEIISGVLDIDILIPTIMEIACSLMNTERCSLFLVDPVKQELITRFHGGLNRSIRMPLNRGIVGHTAVTGNIVNIMDAYSDPRFDKQVDLATGFKTKTILTVPIYNNRGEIAGVTEMINKFDDQKFDEEDIKVLMAFNVFCGISLDNAKLYATSLELTRQLRGFVEMSTALNNTKKIHSVLQEILESAQSVINATRATIFMAEENELIPTVSIGESLVHGSIFADDIFKDKKPRIFSREEIFYKIQTFQDKPIDGLVTSKSLKAVGKHSSSTSSSGLSRIASVLVQENNGGADGGGNENICGIPLISSDKKILGVLELSSTGKIMPEDLKLLDCFAVFTSVSIERSELQEIAQLGHAEVQMKQYLTQEERKSFDIPVKMRIDATHLLENNFDAVAWDGIGHYKVLWAIVNEFNLLHEFKIPNEKWFRFVIEISETYKKVPYHNWRHAVDVCQFTSYEIKLTKMDQRLTKFELLGFIVAAICHDANHDGFTNVYNEKAETPLGILYKNQSVMETHHCTVAITVLSKEECNLFSELSGDQFKSMWTLIFQLILITDMAKHFDFLKQISADIENGPYDESVPENRLKMMQLILKCGDISNVSRPFELADKWCDVLCEEFFRQGDLEMAHGMEYTSPLNDREHLDKPKSQIGFYTFVCLPLYQLAAKVFPELQVNVDQVQSNLSVWKAATEAREKKEQ